MDSPNFDSSRPIYNELNYPINKFYVWKSVDTDALDEQIKNYAIDFCYRSICCENVSFICVAFHTVEDCNHFTNAFEFICCLDMTMNIKVFFLTL